MKKLFFAVSLLSALAAFAAITPRATQTLSFQGIPVEFVFRSLQPGEVLMATLGNSPDIKRVVIQVQGRKYELDSAGEASKPFALIGLDLGLKVEPLTVTIMAEKRDGTIESIQRELAIESREFPTRRVVVSEAMLSPPPHEQERVRREQELVAAVYNIITPEWLGSGNFIAPVDWEAYPNFGQRRIYNRRQRSVHAGVDIAAPWGTRVRASNAGKVVLASHLYLSGKTVIIDHGQGVFSLYCHLSKILMKRGAMVRKSALIGNIGNTGRSTGPHLHWAFKIFDSRVDPFSLVSLPIE